MTEQNEINETNEINRERENGFVCKRQHRTEGKGERLTMINNSNAKAILVALAL